MSDLVGYPIAIQQIRAAATWTRLAGGSLLVYTGPRPTINGDAITSQVLLAEFDVPNPAGEIVNGIFTAAALGTVVVIAGGQVGWVRALDASSGVLADLDAGAVGSGSAAEFDNIALVAGAYISLTSFIVAEG